MVVGCALLTLGSALAGFYFYRSQAAIELTGQTSVAPSALAMEKQRRDIIGIHRPDFSLPDINGQLHHIKEWDGKVIALNFWATWCPPCLKEIPAFIKLQSRYADRDLQFIGIALQKPKEVVEFITEQGVNYPVLAGEMDVIKIARAYGNHLGALPYTVIIGKDGRIAYIKHGELAADTAEDVLLKLL